MSVRCAQWSEGLAPPDRQSLNLPKTLHLSDLHPTMVARLTQSSRTNFRLINRLEQSFSPFIWREKDSHFLIVQDDESTILLNLFSKNRLGVSSRA